MVSPGMENRKWGRTETVVAVVSVLVFLFVYFSPLSISTRYRNSLLRFPDEVYILAEDSVTFEVTATVTLGEPLENHIGADFRLEFYNKGVDLVRDFCWVGKLDALVDFVSFSSPYLNDPGVCGSYQMLWSLRRNLDLLPKGSSRLEASGRGWLTTGLVCQENKAFEFSIETGGLEGLLDALQRPIRLKLVHEGGTEYVEVTPAIISSSNTGG